MVRISKIIDLGLESRTQELINQGISQTKIAKILSNESGQSVSKQSVSRYIGTETQLKTAVVEKKAELQLAVTEAEISTIEDRKKVINGLLGIATSAENEHTRVIAFKEANNALDSLDKRLGKLTGLPGSQEAQTIININQNNLTIKDKIQRYRDAGLFNVSE